MKRWLTNSGKLIPTDEDVYLNRRKFVRDLGVGLAGVAFAGANISSNAYGLPLPAQEQEQEQDSQDKQDEPVLKPDNGSDPLAVPFERPEVFPAKRNSKFNPRTDITPRFKASTHNNFYEFLPDGAGPVYKYVKDFQVDPWSLEISGLCHKPKTFSLDDIFKFEQEERVYHFRCVETWAMNVPWTGFPLSKLLEAVEPKSDAGYVRFITASLPEQMPGMKRTPYYPWPYAEALRMDEALNELTMLVTGIYGKPLLKQHGAPLRIICPWKYGYKSPKSIVKIELTSTQPATFWNSQNPNEYGFLSNVNPNVPHPRWSQAQEYLLQNRSRKIPTQIFNGYGAFVAKMYPDEPKV